ncbi:hypothetical protein [Terribacillus aidingensis]|uniref:hypothetical protein n=1 Tax=Terribacillus aidingensis TaxID=586416 RepID=UPI000BE31F6A|nr:hypothetical protein [Terribacillus aidingensis]
MHPPHSIFAKEFEQLLDLQQFREALFFLKQDNEATTKDQMEVTEVESPPFHEANQAAFFKDKLAAFSLDNLKTDSVEMYTVFVKAQGMDRLLLSLPTCILSSLLGPMQPPGWRMVSFMHRQWRRWPRLGCTSSLIAVIR